MKRIALLGAAAVVSYASAGSFKITPFDIFSNDSQTRRAATSIEKRWAVYVAGCSGSMLNPQYVITAHHCGARAGAVFTSGGCLDLGCSSDLKVVAVAEAHPDLDVDILEVQWTRTDSRWRQRYSPRVETRIEDLSFGSDKTATELFTVGFPGDKRVTMYAEGYAKKKTTGSVYYNIGTINGNSGGPVWTTDTYTLISLTNRGPHELGQLGWRNQNPENPAAWNGGPRIDVLYNQSTILKQIYPDGINRKVSFEGVLIYDNEKPPLGPAY